MKLSYLVTFGLLLLAHGGCTAASADPAKQASEVRKVSDFRGIEIAGVIEVEARIGTTRVEVSGEAEFLDKVTTDVKQGVLVIDTKGQLRHSHLKVTVTAPDYTMFSITGVGSLHASGLSNGKLDVNVSGTGSMQLTGSTGTLKVLITGTGDVRAADLAAKIATIDVSGTGAAHVQATKALEVSLSGTGSVVALGHPASVKKSITGMGSIHVE